MTPHKLLAVFFTPWVTEEVGDGKTTGSSIAPYELEEHFHTFPISCSSGGSESLALGPLHGRSARGDTQCSPGETLNSPPLPFLLCRNGLTPCQTVYGKKLLPLTSPWGLLQVLCLSLDLPEGDHLP